MNNRIVHIAVKVEDLEKTGEFYRNVFGFKEMDNAKVRDHTSLHLSDGTIDLALIKYDSEQSAESKAAGLGPCIHHIGIEVDDMKSYTAEIKKHGCEIISDPGVIPVKFRAPGGTVLEIVPRQRYKNSAAE
ncbi:MAG TPA: VOC family protein [Candidatus Binatia bacterium]|jgi:catechol 2,3-dioxygenase-like lactoylglutathione lyase family enzyme|nr:VOC family protein [Candidatus Binatia bacterium]